MPVRPSLTGIVGLLAGVMVSTSCGETLDSIGCTERPYSVDGGFEGSSLALGPVRGPSAYPNLFKELLKKTDAEIAARIEVSYTQLFHSKSTDESILFTGGPGKAYIRDILHDQIRSEGIGLVMLFAVSLDKRDDFDGLWRYFGPLRVPSGPAQGYFPSFCETKGDAVACYDPYGLQQIATAMLLARGRWKDSPGEIDYGRVAADLLDLIRNKAAYNCGIVDEVTAPFDEKAKLPYATPTPASAGITKTSILMPAYYDLWHQATGDRFWAEAAAAARTLLKAAAYPSTGLFPDQVTFAGEPVSDYAYFGSEALRTLFNLALDRVWSGTQGWVVDEANTLLGFFYGKGINTYGSAYYADGTLFKSSHENFLVAANGALALAATDGIRAEFVQEVWDLGLPQTGTNRYYNGIMQMLSLVMLSGQLRVY